MRGEEPLQPADAAQFVDLLGDPRFETTVQLRYFLGALPEFTETARSPSR